MALCHEVAETLTILPYPTDPQIKRDEFFLSVESLDFSGIYQLSKSRSGRSLGETLIRQPVGEVTESQA